MFDRAIEGARGADGRRPKKPPGSSGDGPMPTTVEV
jgi:hypothetical protein